MSRRWLGLAVLLLAARASTGAEPRAAMVESVYEHHISAPPLRAARIASCGEIRRQSIHLVRSAGETTENSQQRGMQLLTKRLDCRFLSTFYAELRYASMNHVLGEGAWRSCLHFAPVGKLTTAMEVAIYIQCLRLVRNTTACRTVRAASTPYATSGYGSLCAKLLASQDWSQWGLSGQRSKPESLFRPLRREAIRTSGRLRILHLPTGATLRGVIRTGFFFNCCTFGMGYSMPFSYLHLAHTLTVSGDAVGTASVRDVQLDRDVGGSLIDRPVVVSCKSVRAGETAHYALRTYCEGTRVQRVTAVVGH